LAENKIRFDDGAAYERMMGVWSRLAGTIFLDWLAPAPALRWLDVGCGNGAFTELIVERCAPAAVEGIDPSEGQLAFARARHAAGLAKFQTGDALALPFSTARFDVAAMALVIFFVPDPAKGVAEMARVVRPGGTVAAYAWDLPGGGFPMEPIHAEMRAMGIPYLRPPQPDISRLQALRELWTEAGLEGVETMEIRVERSFADFNDFWTTCLLSSSVGPAVAGVSPGEAEALRLRVHARLPADAAGRITCDARANAVKGRVP
jgi:SAM-dependent methyltransferase